MTNSLQYLWRSEKTDGDRWIDTDKSYIMEGAYLYTVISKKGIRPLDQVFLAEDAEDEMIEGWDQGCGPDPEGG